MKTCDCGFAGNPNMSGHTSDCPVTLERENRRKTQEVPEVLTGQVPASQEQVSGNPDIDYDVDE